MLKNDAASNALATVGAVCWSIQLAPQLWKSWKRKSTEGLSGTLLFLWAISGVPLGAYSVAEDLAIALQIQPQLFMFLAALCWGQCIYYHPKPRSLLSGGSPQRASSSSDPSATTTSPLAETAFDVARPRAGTQPDAPTNNTPNGEPPQELEKGDVSGNNKETNQSVSFSQNKKNEDITTRLIPSALNQLWMHHPKRFTGAIILIFLGVSGVLEWGLVKACQGKNGNNKGSETGKTVLAIVAAVLINVGFLPQYWEIYKFKGVVGVSLPFVSIDLLGGLTSFLSLIFAPPIDIRASVSYLGVVAFQAGILVLAAILNPGYNRRMKREKELQEDEVEDGHSRSETEEPEDTGNRQNRDDPKIGSRLAKPESGTSEAVGKKESSRGLQPSDSPSDCNVIGSSSPSTRHRWEQGEFGEKGRTPIVERDEVEDGSISSRTSRSQRSPSRSSTGRTEVGGGSAIVRDGIKVDGKEKNALVGEDDEKKEQEQENDRTLISDDSTNFARQLTLEEGKDVSQKPMEKGQQERNRP